MRLTLKEARESLWNTVVPTLQGDDEQSGLTYIQKFTQYINQAQERLINSGKWSGSYQKARFLAPCNYITLPRRCLSLLAGKYDRNGWQWAARIQNYWYNFLPSYGYNLWDQNLWMGWGFNTLISDLGDGFVTYLDSPYESYYLKFTALDASDAGKTVTVKGSDEYGNPIFTVDGTESYEGFTQVLSAGSVTTTQQFSKQITFVLKERTVGWVTLTAVDVDTGEETQIGSYEPTEENISYRRYKIPYPNQNLSCFEGICKIRYVPCQSDTDEVLPATLGALKNALMALKFEEQADKARYDEYFNNALMLLNDEAKENRGGAQYKLVVDPTAFQARYLNPGY